MIDGKTERLNSACHSLRFKIDQTRRFRSARLPHCCAHLKESDLFLHKIYIVVKRIFWLIRLMRSLHQKTFFCSIIPKSTSSFQGQDLNLPKGTISKCRHTIQESKTSKVTSKR